jgi:hypothetical protein
MFERVHHGDYQYENHWYPKVLNSTMNPLVQHFFRMSNERILTRYAHLHPSVDLDRLRELLRYKPRWFFWSGGDLINVATAGGKRQMVLIETNSCPSGQKSTPFLDDHDEYGGYGRLMAGGVKAFLKGKRLVPGALAVVYDKNYTEASGYAYALSQAFDEPVYLVSWMESEEDPAVRVADDVLQVRDTGGQWIPVRFAFRYLTQRPWNRLPLGLKTHVFNPVVTCLAGGRNKLLAAKAYEFFNTELAPHQLRIQTPETHWDVQQAEVPLWYKRFGGHVVVKNPYGNAGQGIHLITSPEELEAFMATESGYEKYIVQSLIGNHHWSSHTDKGKLYHVGTLPDRNNHTYVADLRLMIHATPSGFRPLGMYSRRARKPLPDRLEPGTATWPILGTNISVRKGRDQWDYDVQRLIVMDRKDFNKLGLGIDDLIEAFMQTVFATVAIDQMADRLVGRTGRLKRKTFYAVNPDRDLLDEILRPEEPASPAGEGA